MKGVLVVALVLLGSCFAASFNHPRNPLFANANKLFKSLNKISRDEAEHQNRGIVQLKPFPCSYGIKITSRSVGIEAYYYFYGFHQMSTIVNSDGSRVTTMLRTDIKDETDPDSFGFVVKLSEDKEGCRVSNYRYIDYSEYSGIDETYFLLTYPFYGCSELSETTFEGEKVINCTQATTNICLLIKDGYLISMGMDDNVALLEYNFGDVRKEFALNRSCELLPEKIYSAPEEIKRCSGKVDILPLKRLPCTYGVEVFNFVGSQKADAMLKKYGDHMLYTSTGDNTVGYLKRSDIKADDPTGYLSALLVRTVIGDECTVSSGYDYWYADMFQSSPYFSFFKEDYNCLERTDVTWNGEKCTKCTTFGGLHVILELYEKDGLIIGVSLFGQEMRFNYIFEDMRMDMALNASCEDSSIPKEAYSAPNETKGCGCKPISRDGASTVSAVGATIISMVMITLLSLF